MVTPRRIAGNPSTASNADNLTTVKYIPSLKTPLPLAPSAVEVIRRVIKVVRFTMTSRPEDNPKQFYERTTNTTTNCQIAPSPQFARAQSNHPTYAQVIATNMAVNNATMDQFSTFLNEFKNMFLQLLKQNNMIISMLTTVINKLT